MVDGRLARAKCGQKPNKQACSEGDKMHFLKDILRSHSDAEEGKLRQLIEEYIYRSISRLAVHLEYKKRRQRRNAYHHVLPF
jgi:hypothetical protein